MKRSSSLFALVVLSLTLLPAAAARHGEVRLAESEVAAMPATESAASRASAGQSDRVFTVEGVQREALIYARHSESADSVARTRPPLVLVFHGHGGRARAVAQRFAIHQLWPEAVVVYLQGLPGVEGINDPEGRKSGWQKSPGQLGDRDVKFVDAVLAGIGKDHGTDPNRVYALGHSNGGRFVNVLWNVRGDKFAALCSASGPGGPLIEGAIPKSIFIIAGEKDPIVPFQSQSSSIELARKLLKTNQSKATVEGYARMEPGIDGTELVTYIHPGGHEVPPEALPLVVSFFRRHVKQ